MFSLNMFSQVSRQLWSLGRVEGLGRDLFHFAYEIQERKQSSKAQGLADALAQVSHVTQALQWPWQEGSFVSVLHWWTDYPYCCCGLMIYSHPDLGQWLQHRLHALKFGDDDYWGILETATETGNEFFIKREAYYLECGSFIYGQSPRRGCLVARIGSY